MNPEKPHNHRHRNELDPIVTQMVEDAVRIAETRAIIASANEQIAVLEPLGHHDVVALLKEYRDAAQKEYDLRENLRTSTTLAIERTVIHDDTDAQPDNDVIEESVKFIPKPGEHEVNISVTQSLIEDAFAQREFYHKILQEHYPNENSAINKTLQNMKKEIHVKTGHEN